MKEARSTLIRNTLAMTRRSTTARKRCMQKRSDEADTGLPKVQCIVTEKGQEAGLTAPCNLGCAIEIKNAL